MKAKKLFSLTSATALSIALLAGCGSSNNDSGSTGSASPAPSSSQSSPSGDSSQSAGLTKETAAGGAYANLDTSKPATITWFALGDQPADLDAVLKEANDKYLKPVLNAELQVKFMSWSDWTTKYPLVLSGGEDADLIYTAQWAFFQQEGSKGAFKEMSDDFVKTNMPLTYQNQAKDSWDEVRLGGKVYAVTRNTLPLPNYKFMAIRDDLVKKYNLAPVTDLASFQNYVFTIAEKEKGVEGVASSGSNSELRDIIALQNNGVYSISASNYPFVYKDNNGLTASPTPDEVEFLYSSQYYKGFIDLMKEWAAKGVWSKNAINNTVTTADAYGQGKSGALPWTDAVFGYGQQLESANLGTAAYVDITKQIVPRSTIYSGDAMAIPNSSKNPERAGMVLDYIKNDKDLNYLITGGIEGKHYILESDGTYSKGPDADKYGMNAFAWGVQNDWSLQPHDRDPRELAIVNDLKSREKALPINGFIFDQTPVKNEMAVINSLVTEYSAALELGMYGDKTDAKWAEFQDKLQKSGLEKVMTELKKQYGDYLAAHQN